MTLPLDVVGIMFFQDGKLLISKSHNCKTRNLYTLVGGKREKGETLVDAAVRECKEEIGENFEITKENLVYCLDYTEKAASDPSLTIHMHVFLSTKEIDIPLHTSSEIIDYRWYSIEDDSSILSPSILYHILDYAKNKKLLY